MSGFPYTNPYSQPDSFPPPKDVDEALNFLENSGQRRSPSSKVWLALSGIDTTWTLRQVMRFVKWVESNKNQPSESCCWVIHWLVQDRRWDLSSVYAAATYGEATLLAQYLQEASSSDDEMIQAAATCATISIWNALECLQKMCSISSEHVKGDCWWGFDGDLFLPIALKGLMFRQDHWKPEIFRSDVSVSLCDFKACCIETIVHHSTDVTLQDIAGNQDMLRRLHQESSRLKIFYTPFSLGCLQLLSMVAAGEAEFEKLLEDLLPQIVRSAFMTESSATGQPGSPRWTEASSLPSFRLVEHLFRGRPGTIGQALSDHASIDRFADNVAAWGNDMKPKEDHLVRLIFLHKACRCAVRHGLSNSLRKNEKVGLHNVIEYLLRCAQKFRSVHAAVLAREMMTDRLEKARQDELSRNISCCDDLWFDWAVELAASTQEDYLRPMLIICTDVCFLLGLPQHIPADAVEAFAGIAAPVYIRTEGPEVGSDGDTPTAQNLSRADHSMLWVEEKRVSRGMDTTVRLAASSILARVVLTSSGALRNRALDVANAVASERDSFCSPDYCRRRLRLRAALSTSENEAYLSSMLYGNEADQSLQVENLDSRLAQTEQQISELEQKCDMLSKEKDASALHLASMKLRFHREMAELKRNAVRESSELVQVHIEKYNATEKENHELIARLQVVESELEARKESESQAQTALVESNEKLSAALTEGEAVQQRLASCETELRRTSDEVSNMRQQLEKEGAKAAALERELEQNHQQITELEDSEQELREGLENLFGDMVSLARMYEYQESKMETSAETQADLAKLKKQLHEMQKANKRMSEQETRIKYDNELLQKKYNKAKEKLEKEREDRQREDEQRRKRASGPVSYMNQLHNESRSSKTSSSYGRNSKENRSMSSSTSRSRR